MSLKNLLQGASLAAAMIERRDFLKRIYGEHYAERTNNARAIILAVAKRDGLSKIEAALAICQRAVEQGSGGAVNPMIAALVDLCEENDC